MQNILSVRTALEGSKKNCQCYKPKWLIGIAASGIFSIQLDLMLFLGLRNQMLSLVSMESTAQKLTTQNSSMLQV